MQSFVYFIEPARPEMIQSPTEEESRLIGEHFRMLKAATESGRVLLAGPSLEPPHTGIVVFTAKDRADAEAFLATDAAVAAGVFKARLAPMAVSLMAGRDTETDFGRRHGTAPIREQRITKTAELHCTLDEAWDAWTSSEGMAAWWVEESRIDPRPGGKFELYMGPGEPGQRGSEGCRVLSVLPKRMFSFEWNAPPSFPEWRAKRKNHVVLEFAESAPGKVSVTLTHLGWQEDEESQKVYAYFDRAWGYVMGLLEKRFPAPG
ncbi:MAG: SRPBCC domain-containing protein [Candidatus Sumerlaeia bacterium]|nr:SRPBCC domain-containing protein [Candidatus Sumerlaeia bacterium]